MSHFANASIKSAEPTGMPISARLADPATRHSSGTAITGALRDVPGSVELMAVGRTFAQLPPAPSQELFSHLLADGPSINNLVGGLDSSGQQALSVTEKHEFFRDLASNLEGEQLSQFGEMLGDDSRDILAAAVSRHANPGTAERFFARSTAMESAALDKASSEILPSGDVSAHDIQASQGGVTSARSAHLSDAAAATTLAGLQNDPAAFDAMVLELMQSGRLDGALAAGLALPEIAPPLWGANISAQPAAINTDLTTAIIAAAANSDHPDVQAAVFAAGTQATSTLTQSLSPFDTRILDWNGADAQINSALTALLASNPNQIIYALRTDGAFETPLTAYVDSVIATGQIDQLGSVIAQLGAELDSAIAEDGGAQQGDPEQYACAENLGFLLGTTLEGIDSLNRSLDQQIDLCETLVNGIVGAAGALLGAPGGVAGGVLQTLVSLGAQSLSAANAESAEQLQQAFIELARPTDPQGNHYLHNSVSQGFTDGLDASEIDD